MNMFKPGATAVVMILALSAPAEAQLTLISPSVACATGSTSWTPSFTACEGAFVGNNNNQSEDVLSHIESTWSLTNVSWADGVEEFVGTDGTIEFASPFDTFILALKQGNGFSLFYFDGTEGELSEVDYVTSGVKAGETNDLSHWTLYTGDGVSVPEPGTMLLLGTGLLGMAAVRRRREDVA
jgi:hypothetical protein